MSWMVPRRGAPLVALALIWSMPALVTPGLATAEPDPNSVATLIADVAEANQRLQDLGAQIQTQQESVNKALVALQDARDNAATAQQRVDSSAAEVTTANTAITDAQQRFDTVAAANYMSGPSNSLVLAQSPDDIIASASANESVITGSQQVLANLQQARTDQVNKDSLARQAKQEADQATANAQASQDGAVQALKDAQQKFGQQQAEVNLLAAQRDAAQAKLLAARPAPAAPAAPGQAPAAAPEGQPAVSAAPAAPGDWDHAPAAPVADPSQWDTTLPMVPSAFVSGDPIAIVNQVLQISSSSAQVTADLGRKFLEQIGILKPADTGITNGTIPRVYGQQAVEYVIKRGSSQMGVPYSWGGGNASGPSRGIDDGANTVGFDCSGLILYAFAGVGIKLPHYSGSQYDMGRKIPSSQMQRGDVIFYGPGGSQHVTLYLGNGQMLEAPYTGSHVKVSPVRTGGMTPYVIRYIEY